MKKIILLLIACLQFISLTSCFENSQVEETENKEIVENKYDKQEDNQKEHPIHIHEFILKNVDGKYLKAEASCTEGIQCYYSCSCGEKGEETFVIGTALGHSFSDWTVYKEATYTEEGIKRKTCSLCGTYEEIKIEKIAKPKEEAPIKPVVKEEPKVEKPVTEEVKEEIPSIKEDPKPAKQEINVPATEKKELTIDKISQFTKTINPAEFIIYKGSITKEGEVHEYSFTAPRDGIYNFEFSGIKSGFKTDFYIYNDLGEIVQQTYYGGVENGTNIYYISSAEKTYTLKIKQHKSTGDYVLKIGIKKPTVDISEFTIIKDSIEYQNQTNTYTFTPPRQGIYNFNFSGIKSGVEADFFIYDDLGEVIKQTYYGGVENSTDVSAILNEGKQYTLKINQYKNIGSYTMNIGLKKPAVDITDYTTIKDSIEYANQSNNYTFIVPRDGRYRFEFSGMKNGLNADIFVYNNLNEIVQQTYYGVSNGEGVTVYDLKEGEIYAIYIDYHSGIGDYILNIGCQKKYVDINSTSIVNDSIEFTDQRNVYNFTVTKDGTHTFTITGLDSGKMVELMAFNELGETVTKNSYCKNSGEITLKDLKVGEKYEIQVRYKNGKNKYKLTVK